MRQLTSIALATFALAACDAAPLENGVAADAKASSKKLEGYGKLKFGMSFTEAMAQTDSDRFNPYGLKECLEDMPLKGCFLSPDTDATPFIMRGGIPYGLQLEFNKYDQLTDIGLRYTRRGKITRQECLSLYGRTLDWASHEFGQLYESLGETKHLKQRTSPGGIAFRVYEESEPNFVTNFLRTASQPPSAAVRAKPIGKWDNERYVSLLSYYIVATDEPHCEIMIDFNDAPSVERRPMDKQPESTATAEPEPELSEETSASLDGTDEDLANHDGWVSAEEWNETVDE